MAFLSEVLLRTRIAPTWQRKRYCFSCRSHHKAKWYTFHMSFQKASTQTDLKRIDYNKLSPMLKHFWDTKQQHPDYLLLYRVGDFFESFFEDAIILSEKLEVTLTSKDGGKDLGFKVPMSGIPQHSLDKYLSVLLKKNVKVAVCDQTEPATLTQAGSLVKREVTRLLTPGTLTEDSMLDAKKNNYLAAMVVNMGNTDHPSKAHWAIAYVDTSTGEFQGLEGTDIEVCIRELNRIAPSEVLIEENAIWNTSWEENEQQQSTTTQQHLSLPLPDLCYTTRPTRSFDSQFGKQQLLQRFHCNSTEVFGLKETSLLLKACAAIFHYLEETIERIAPIDLRFFQLQRADEFVYLDENTLRNLEVLVTLREGNKKGSLLWSVDRTFTCMGARLLRRWLLHPLRDWNTLQARYDFVELLVHHSDILSGIVETLKGLNDLERLACRIGSLRANEKDFYALGESLKKIPRLLYILHTLKTTCVEHQERVVNLLEDILEPLSEELIRAMVEEIDANVVVPCSNPPSRAGVGNQLENVSSVQKEKLQKNGELEELEKEYELHMKWILEYERKERKRLGWNSLKIGYQKSLGYYISISKRAISKVPSDYIRKQTLTGEERYTTASLIEREQSILHIRECIAMKEREIFDAFRNHLQQYAPRIQNIAQSIATLDVFCGLAKVAMERGYCRPQLQDNKNGAMLVLRNGRHPVVEQMIAPGSFVSNSIELSHESSRLIVLTGPNSSGKSCYLRQIGTIQLLAQIGSFVPAEEAQLSIMDAIFTRVGAVDDIGSGQSTFMVEMTETARILRQATNCSLVLLDEIGRGTTTLDGLSIAWSVAEYLSSHIQCLSIFATHYHEMNELATIFPWVTNLQVKVIERDDQVIFLHKVVPGGANKSYGIQVAGLAGLPVPVVERAQNVWKTLEQVGMQMSRVLKTQLYQVGSFTESIASREESKHCPPHSMVKNTDQNMKNHNNNNNTNSMENIQQQLQAMKQQLGWLESQLVQLQSNHKP